MLVSRTCAGFDSVVGRFFWGSSLLILFFHRFHSYIRHRGIMNMQVSRLMTSKYQPKNSKLKMPQVRREISLLPKKIVFLAIFILFGFFL